MTKRKYSYMELGMLFGMFVGGGLATILFATTGKAAYYALVGIGLALGLSLGAAFDGAKEAEKTQNE